MAAAIARRLVGGRFAILRPIGAGGMGSVVLAEDTWRDRRLVALKLASREDSGATKALEHEFLLLSTLAHPYIVSAREFGTCEETRQAWFSMEHAAGPTLADAAAGLAPRGIAALLAQLARGLDFLHSRRWVHGDVKSENVAVVEAATSAGGSSSMVRLLDFGLARRAGEESPHRGFSGTLSHAAPEVLAGATASPRSDLYALGVVAHELFAGEMPFTDKDALALAEAHRHRPAPALASRVSGLPRAATDLVDRLLAKEPDSRPRDGAAVAEALERAFPGSGAESLDASLAWASAPRLIARDEAEAACIELIARASDSGEEGPRVLWLLGGEGQGKSKLLQRVASRMQAARGVVLEGSPGDEPFTLLSRPLRDVIRLIGADDPVVTSRAGALSAVLPEFAASAPAEAPGLEDRLLAVADAAWDLLRTIATRPVVLLLDDLDRAQPEDLRILEMLARVVELDRVRGRRTAFAIAGALTELGASGERGAVLLDQGRTLRLAPLGLEDVSSLVSEMFPRLDAVAALAGLIAGEGGGSGRRTEEWCAELVRRGLLLRSARGFSLDISSDAARQPPPGEAERAAREVAALGGRSLALLAAAAVSPAPLEPAVLGRAVGLAGAELESTLDDLERRGLIVVLASPQGRRVSVPSRDVAETARASHAEAAGFAGRLLDDPARGFLTPGDRALLAERAGRVALARTLLHEALAEAGVRTDVMRAAALAGRLAEISEGRERRDALRRQAQALIEADRPAQAEELAARARAEGLADAGEGCAQALVEASCARSRGRPAQAASLLRTAIEEASAAGVTPSFEAEKELTRVLVQLGDPDSAVLARRLLARRGLLPEQRLSLRLLEASRLMRSGENDEARRLLEAARRDARALNLAVTEAVCENNLGLLALRDEAPDVSRRHLDRAVRLRRKLGLRSAAASTLSNLALLELHRRRFRDAGRHARAAAEIFEDIGNVTGIVTARLNGMVAATGTDDFKRFDQLAESLEGLVEEVGDPVLRAMLHLVVADNAVQTGNLDAARAALGRLDAVGAERRLILDGRLLVAQHAPDGGEAASLAKELLACQEIPKLSATNLVGLSLRLADVPAGFLVSWAGAIPIESEVGRFLSEAGQEVASRSAAPVDSRNMLIAQAAWLARTGAPSGEVGKLIRRSRAIVLAPPDNESELHGLAAGAWLAEQAGDLVTAEQHVEQGISILRRRSMLLPAGKREMFLARRDRAAFRLALLDLRRKRLEAAREQGWERLSAPRAGSRSGTSRRASDAAASRALQTLRRRGERLVEILEIARGISSLLPMNELLARALASAMRFMDADRAFIVLGRPGEALEFAASRDRAGREVPRAGFAISHSVLDEVVRTRQPVLSSDAREDERFVSKASVLALDLRSVVVAPLVASSEVIGAIYLDNLQASGVFDAEDKDLLGLLAAQVAVAVENARLHEARLEKERIEQELSVARGIQQALLPRSLPEGGMFRLAAIMHPARELGGDWYDLVPGDDGSFTLTVGDVSGKGVGAALFMVMARTILRAELEAGLPLDRWLISANAEIAAQLDDDKFLTLVALRAGGDGRSVRYALAGHEPPIVYRSADSTADAVEEGGLALGMLPSLAGRIEERHLLLAPGDLIACVSDGVTECRGASGELYGRERLRACVAAMGRLGASVLLEGLLGELDSWRGTEERSDDITIVVLESRS